MSFALLIAGAAMSAPADAQQAGKGTDIGSQIYVQGATITGPCIRVPKRELSSPQAALFVQSWLGNSIFGHPTVQDPPAALPVCRVSVRYTVADRRLAPMQVDYASDGKTAWVALPPQNLWPGAFVTVHRWTVALPSAVAAFAGKGTPQPVATAAPSTTAPPTDGSAAPAPAKKSSSDGANALWMVVGLVVVIALVAGTGYVVARRRALARSGA
ncbi:MAG TPA: hypothetical protein VKJ07_16535 [Mycobacteriales bacterium]|nr:hypothetical protein [Mycobacteriales bacterium]